MHSLCYLPKPYHVLYFIDSNSFYHQFIFNLTTQELYTVVYGYFAPNYALNQIDPCSSSYHKKNKKCKMIHCKSLDTLFVLDGNRIYHASMHFKIISSGKVR